MDLRSNPTWERHGIVCSAFSELGDDEALHVIYDYEPRPLRRRFETTFPQQFVWAQRRLAHDRWEVSLRKVPLTGDVRSTVYFMQRCPIFSSASESTRRMLASVADAQSVRCKTTIAEQDIDWPFLGVVRKGRAFAIIGSPAGRNQILFEALETEVFGNIVIFDGGSTIARFATLAESADLLLFPRKSVLQAAEADSRFALALAAAATQQVRTIADLVNSHISKNTSARVAAAIRPYAPIESGLAMVDSGHLPSLRLTQLAIASGTVKAVAARAVAELEQGGAVRRVRGRIAYIDRARLAGFDL